MTIRNTRRQKKYPDTATFKYENRNPRGRITGDCEMRAISIALEKDWCEVVRGLADLACDTGYSPFVSENYGLYLERNGFKKMPQPRHSDGTKYTLREFIEEHKRGVFVVNMPSHLTVVKAGKCHDIWDCSRSSRRIGNYWMKGR